MGVNSLPKTVTDSVAAVIWTWAFCAWVQHANHSATEALVTQWYTDLHFTIRQQQQLKTKRREYKKQATKSNYCETLHGYFPKTVNNTHTHTCTHAYTHTHTQTHTHTRLMAIFPGLPGWASTRKVKPIWTLLKQETVSDSGINWAMCKYASRSRQITMPVPHYSSFLQAGCPSCRRTNSVKALKAIHTQNAYIILNTFLPYGGSDIVCVLCGKESLFMWIFVFCASGLRS